MVGFEAGLTDKESSTKQLDLYQAASLLEKTLQDKLFYRLEKAWLAERKLGLQAKKAI